MTLTLEMRERHFVGGLLLGAYGIPGDFDETPPLTDERLRWVLDATTIAARASGVWPVDLNRVAGELARLGVLEEVGGRAFLHELIESWDEREDRAYRLGLIMAAHALAVGRLEQQAAAEEHLVAALRRFETSKEKANEAIALMQRAVNA
jgi:hypothetical protein